MADKLYLVKVPVAFFVRASDENKATNAYYTLDQMDMGADDFIYFGDLEIEEVF